MFEHTIYISPLYVNRSLFGRNEIHPITSKSHLLLVLLVRLSSMRTGENAKFL